MFGVNAYAQVIYRSFLFLVVCSKTHNINLCVNWFCVALNCRIIGIICFYSLLEKPIYQYNVALMVLSDRIPIALKDRRSIKVQQYKIQNKCIGATLD